MLLLALLVAIAAVFVVAGPRIGPDDADSRMIRLSRAEQAKLAGDFAQREGRPPSAAEHQILIDGWVREEILYREALRRGLGKHRQLARAELVQAMDAQAGAADPDERVDDVTLGQWMRDRPELFASDMLLTFDQAHFSTRGRAIVGRTLLGGGADWTRISDPDGPVARFAAADRAEVTAAFGRDFGRIVEGLSPGSEWQGPVEGKGGWHLVRLVAREPGAFPPLAEVRAAVETDWRRSSAAARSDAAYQALRSGYTVQIDQ